MNNKGKKTVSIRIRLICVIIPIVLVIIVAFFALSRDVIIDMAKDNLSVKSEVYTGDISSWTNKIFGEIEVYKDTIIEAGFENDEEILEYMRTSVGKSDAYPIGLYMGDDDGVYLDGSDWVPGDDWVLTEREWYIEGKEHAEFAFGEPYYDSQSGQVCVSASVHMSDYKKATRVLAIDVYLDYVSEVVGDIAKEEECKAFLVTKTSRTIIAHPDKEMMAKTLDDKGIDELYVNISKIVEDGNTKIVEVEGDDGKYYVAINPVDNTDWYMVTYMSRQDVLSQLTKLEIIMVAIAIVAAVILIAMILRIMNRVVKPVEKLTGIIGNIAEGDFTQNIQISGNDEIAMMSNNMQQFITQMRGTIGELTNTADWLNNQSRENEKISSSLMGSSNNQMQSAKILGDMVEKLSTAANDVTNQMENLARLVEKTKDEGKYARELMQESVEVSESGRSDMVSISGGMKDISTSISLLSEQITRVGDATAKIGDMVNIIMDIAEETNLLSLNASIEAARAGEAGRGFAVVAEEIGKLATNSAMAADDISGLTAQIIDTVEVAVKQMKESVTAVQDNAGIVMGAGATFEELYNKVENTSKRVEEMIELVEQVDVVARQMNSITHGQQDATERIVSLSNELEVHTKNVTVNSDAVANSAVELKKEAVELMSKMEKFKI